MLSIHFHTKRRIHFPASHSHTRLTIFPVHAWIFSTQSASHIETFITYGNRAVKFILHNNLNFLLKIFPIFHPLTHKSRPSVQETASFYGDHIFQFIFLPHFQRHFPWKFLLFFALLFFSTHTHTPKDTQTSCRKENTPLWVVENCAKPVKWGCGVVLCHAFASEKSFKSEAMCENFPETGGN